MILSIKHKFIFIKGYKVAGTSIEMALASLCGPDDIVTPILPVDEVQRLRTNGYCRNYSADVRFEKVYLKILSETAAGDLPQRNPPESIFYNHMPLTEVAQLYEGSLADFKIVCAERSPYAKVLSWLNMQNAMPAYRRGGEMLSDPSGFRKRLEKACKSGAVRTVRNIDRYKDKDGALHVEVMRYETLQRDFDRLLASFGAGPVTLPHAKKGLMSDTLDAREIFRRDQLNTLNSIFADEFDAFGYPRL
jgi:hypothetical protein